MITYSEPNHETIRHLCHLAGASQYYLLTPQHYQHIITQTSAHRSLPASLHNIYVVNNAARNQQQTLSVELSQWCGMNIQTLTLDSPEPYAKLAQHYGKGLHNAALIIDLVEDK